MIFVALAVLSFFYSYIRLYASFYRIELTFTTFNDRINIKIEGMRYLREKKGK